MTRRKINLTTITSKFGRAYDRAAKAEASKKKAQADFFSAINAVLEDEVRRQILITQLDKTITPEVYVERQHPGFRFVEAHGDQLLIEEDPQFMKFGFVNPQDKKVYQRTISQASSSLDDERLRKENPDLWEQVTEWPTVWMDLIVDYALQWNLDQTIGSKQMLLDSIDQYLRSKNFMRILKDPSRWTEEELEAAAPYIVPGKVTTRLVKPREANIEELDAL